MKYTTPTPRNATFQEMQAELRKQKPHTPDPEAWKGVSLANTVVETQEWVERLSDIAPEPQPETPDPAFPVDQYIDDTERTRAWLKGTDMRRAEKWIHSTLPTAYHVMTELADQMKCTYTTDVKKIAGTYLVTVEIYREVIGGFDVMTKTERAETESDVPVVEAILYRDLLVDSVGKYGIKKANEVYRNTLTVR